MLPTLKISLSHAFRNALSFGNLLVTYTMRTRIKICGITRVEDALCAAMLGADAIGLVFYQGSPRLVSIEQAMDIVRKLPPFVTVVGLFVDARPEEIHAVLKHVRLDLIQFHGDETPRQCRGFDRPYIKAIRVHAGLDIVEYADRYADASGFLMDSYRQGVPGGTGKTFDWSCVPGEMKKPILLAGGLTAENVGKAITTLHPYGVDVSGGVESSKGIKNPDKMAAFITSVQGI